MMKLFNSKKSYVQDVTELIDRWINKKNDFPENAVLAVMPELMTTVIDDADDFKNCDIYELSQFVMKDKYGKSEPNMRAIINMADRYFSV